MQCDTSGKYIHSVSDLCGADEIEFLLDDIKDLEPHSYKPEDLQDFEIAGSQTDGVGALTDQSPLADTVHSWDSHVNYRLRLDASEPTSLFNGVIVYCDYKPLLRPIGFVRLLLLISSIACLGFVCLSGTVHVGLFMLPLVGRIRFIMFIAIFTALATGSLIILDITHMIYLFAFNWNKINAIFYLSISVLYLLASSLILHMVLYSESFVWVPKHTKLYLLITGCVGCVCVIECILLASLHKVRLRSNYDLVSDEVQFTLQERVTTTSCAISNTAPTSIGANTANQINLSQSPSVMYYPPAIPSTSRQGNALHTSASRHGNINSGNRIPTGNSVGPARSWSANNDEGFQPPCSSSVVSSSKSHQNRVA